MTSVYRNFIAIESENVPNVVVLVQIYSLKDVREDFIGSINVHQSPASALTQSIKRLVVVTGNGNSFNFPGTRLTVNIQELFKGSLNGSVRQTAFPLGSYKTIKLSESGKEIKLLHADSFNEQSSVLDSIIQRGAFIEVNSEKKKKEVKKDFKKEKKNDKKDKKEKKKNNDVSESSTDDKKNEEKEKVVILRKKRNDYTQSDFSQVGTTDIESKISGEAVRNSWRVSATEEITSIFGASATPEQIAIYEKIMEKQRIKASSVTGDSTLNSDSSFSNAKGEKMKRKKKNSKNTEINGESMEDKKEKNEKSEKLGILNVEEITDSDLRGATSSTPTEPKSWIQSDEDEESSSSDSENEI